LNKLIVCFYIEDFEFNEESFGYFKTVNISALRASVLNAFTSINYSALALVASAKGNYTLKSA
jgi:hypothetical protein